ncbi:MAG: acyltransferase [Chloroflexi bacterium]|nr:MAG: acyltransferase [Chloroflexota bacterium]
MQFRPELEGLRGVAVALVVLFHARLLGFSGGFVGVDAFYVLSGFLITRLLLGEIAATGSLDLVTFYARRARRILPAAIAAVVVVLACSAFVVAPLDLPAITVDATASGLFAGNVLFAIRATDYFASTTPSPFLHYWSLGVEEQFYLVWPLFLLLAFRSRRPSLIICAACLGSLALAIVLTPVLAPWAFYGLPTRAWQLAAGALLAMHRPALSRLPSLALGVCAWIGLALLAVASTTLDPTAGYPGVAAIVPTLAVVLAICGSDRRGGPGRLLALAPLRALGRISLRSLGHRAVVPRRPRRRRRGDEPEADRAAVPRAASIARDFPALARVRGERDRHGARRRADRRTLGGVVPRGERRAAFRRCDIAGEWHVGSGHAIDDSARDGVSDRSRHSHPGPDARGPARAATAPDRCARRWRWSERARLRPLAPRQPATALRSRRGRSGHGRAGGRLARGSMVSRARPDRGAARLADPAVHEGLVHLPRHAHHFTASRARVHRVRSVARERDHDPAAPTAGSRRGVIEPLGPSGRAGGCRCGASGGRDGPAPQTAPRPRRGDRRHAAE